MKEGNDKTLEEIFYEMFDKLPRKGPGSFESTQKAFNFVQDKLNEPKILDIGCGNGKQSFDLINLCNGTITAIDNYPPYIEEMNKKIVSTGLQQRIKAEVADMFDLQYTDNSFNLIWSEGAIYIIGFEKGLCEFKRLLIPGGFVCVSELSWLVDNLSGEPFKFWANNYPGINTIEKNNDIANSCGYNNIGHFVLPESDWLNIYYKYLSENLFNMKEKYKSNFDALELIKAEEYEIDLYKKYSNEYGYVFYIMQLKD